MKTSIEISGQIAGNFNLCRKIQTIDSEVIKTMFNGFRITFNTKKEAVKALSEANKAIKTDEPDFYKEGVSYRPGYGLWYDASKAIIS